MYNNDTITEHKPIMCPNHPNFALVYHEVRSLKVNQNRGKMKEQDYIDSKHIAANTNDYRIEEVHQAFDMIDKWEFAKEQVIKELERMREECKTFNEPTTGDDFTCRIIGLENQLKQK